MEHSKDQEDMQHVDEAHRPTLWKLQTQFGEPGASLLKAIQTGGVHALERKARRDEEPVPLCICGRGARSVEHQLWTCALTEDLWEPFLRTMRQQEEPPLNITERRCALPMNWRTPAFTRRFAVRAVAGFDPLETAD